MSRTPPTLDELVATLARVRPSIDDAVNQRIKARIDERIERRIEAQIEERIDSCPTPRRRWNPFRGRAIAFGLATIALAAVLTWIGPDREKEPQRRPETALAVVVKENAPRPTAVTPPPPPIESLPTPSRPSRDAPAERFDSASRASASVAAGDSEPKAPLYSVEAVGAVYLRSYSAVMYTAAIEREMREELRALDKLLEEAESDPPEEEERDHLREIQRAMAKIEGLVTRASAVQATAMGDRLLEVAKIARAKAAPPLRELGENQKVRDKVTLLLLVTAADTDIEIGNLSTAKTNLDKASQAMQRDNDFRPQLDLSYGKYYEARAETESDLASKRRLLRLAMASYERSSLLQARKRIADLNRILSNTPMI